MVKNLALLTLSKNFISKNKPISSLAGSLQRYVFTFDSSHFGGTMELNMDICCDFGDFFLGLEKFCFCQSQACSMI